MSNPRLTTEDEILKFIFGQGIPIHAARDLWILDYGRDTDMWRVRETIRMQRGLYTVIADTALPSSYRGWWRRLSYKQKHYVHMSTTERGMVSYTPDDASGQQDRQVKTRIGRYLRRIFSEDAEGPDKGALTDVQISEIANYFTRQFLDVDSIKWARTREEIRHVYCRGPRSCMSYPIEDYDTDGIHPTEAYASPDIAIAYIEEGGRITARACVNMKDGIFGRVYGNVILERLLNTNYASVGDGAWARGLRVLNIETDVGTVGPYIDGCHDSVYRKRGDTTYLYIDPPNKAEFTYVGSCTESHDSKGFFCRDTDPEDSRECAECGDVEHIDEMHYLSYEDEWVCSYCHNHETTQVWTGRCDSTQVRTSNIDMHDFIEIGDTYYEDCDTAEMHGWREIDGDWHSEDDVVECAVLGEYILKDDAQLIHTHYGIAYVHGDVIVITDYNGENVCPQVSDVYRVVRLDGTFSYALSTDCSYHPLEEAFVLNLDQVGFDRKHLGYRIQTRRQANVA